MTITAIPTITDGRLTVRGKVVLDGVPDNVVVSPASSGSAFIGATSTTETSLHVFTLGVLEGYRLLCLFRFKIWWMIPRMGKAGGDIPIETQMLLLEAREDSALHDEDVEQPTTENTFYILMLPVLDGQFRTSLQGTPTNELQFCVESGDPDVQCSQSLEAVFINSGDNPYKLMNESFMILEKHKDTFSLIKNKKIPHNLDWFGWCTWDAFYTEVDPQGIKEGLESLAEGGCPPRFLIIDDGWQDTINEFSKEGEPFLEGTQFATRLVDIKENNKFTGIGSNSSCENLHQFIKTIKDKYGLKYVYVWHALLGYWGGLLPTSKAMKKYNPRIVYPVQSPGNIGNIRDVAMDSLEKYGVGMIDPTKILEFYDDLHSYLASSGVDGVKVDVQNVIETLGSGYGGRVSLTRQCQQALEASVARNFEDNNLICCMNHNSDYIYSSRKSAVARASEDFMPREPNLQTLHIASVAFNSLLLGEIVVPDWDMFHSKHVTAEFHGAARALGGCGVYVSDKPGNHDFKVLKKLVLPDGSILRARHAGRPTRDCLFEDPVMDGKSLLKIWNLNKLSGVIGVFNCQGVGHWPLKESAHDYPTLSSKPSYLSGHVSPDNVEFLEDVAGENWTGDCAVYAFNSGSLSQLPRKGIAEVSLGVLQCEIYTISPIREYNQNVHFAPIGLINMYNSGGAVEALNCVNDPSGCTIKIKGKGCGRFGAYSSTKPKYCLVDANKEEFDYNADDQLLTLKLPLCSQDASNFREIEFVY
ncbi:probable galactinol--sucrose galactosyltransferase 2 isoform X1 [Telopea speciosissima]|uniref:probable galactinol--sucrose galactosyltransferase 2 isoform X1 n=1 Tax=Telopea speciosissima TaxID=54955 RepID=UPI001CC782E6|nr:probable galactinol--sucrose galactosyltransferase 2 isoform X1 [Telopea speciosissima]